MGQLDVIEMCVPTTNEPQQGSAASGAPLSGIDGRHIPAIGEIMTNPRRTPESIDEYISASCPTVRPVLKEIRRVIRAAAPDAEELISYRMPAFKLHGILVYFAAFKSHIGLYPPVSGDVRLEKALAPYAGPKGNLKFPLDRPVPYALIRRIIQLKVKQNFARTASGRRVDAQKQTRKHCH